MARAEEIKDFPTSMVAEEVSDFPAAVQKNIDRENTKKDIGFLDSVGVGLAGGLTSNFDDETIGALRAITEDGILPGQDGWDAAYTKRRDEVREYNKLVKEKYPWTAGITEGLGFAATLPKSLAVKGGASALAHMAGRGGVYGAGQAEEIEDIPREALEGAALGAATQAVAPLVGPALGRVGQGVSKGVQAIGSGTEAATRKVMDKGVDWAVSRATDAVVGRTPEPLRAAVNNNMDNVVFQTAATLEKMGKTGLAKNIIDEYTKDPQALLRKMVGKSVLGMATGGVSLVGELSGKLGGKGLQALGKGMNTVSEIAGNPQWLLNKTKGTKYYSQVVRGITGNNVKGLLYTLVEDPEFRELIGYKTETEDGST